MKIQRRRPRFSIRALLLFTSVVALVLGYRQYVVFRIHAMNDGIRRAKIEMKRLGGYSGEDLVLLFTDPSSRSWLDFVLVIPPRIGYCELYLKHSNVDTVLEILSSSGLRSIQYVGWHLERDYDEIDKDIVDGNESDEHDADAKPPVQKKFTYVASTSLDRLSKFEIGHLLCFAPVSTKNMSKFNTIHGLDSLTFGGDWLTDEHLKLLQPSASLRQLDLTQASLTNITEEELTKLIDRMTYPMAPALYPSPLKERLHDYATKKREISNLNKNRR